jgi:methyltransferase (TIGR00027 family)
VSVGWEQPARLHFIPADFSRENPAKALASSPYDPDAPSFFSWLGVTYYLERDAVSDTLRAVAEVAQPGSRIVFDYLDDVAFVPGRTARRVQRGMDYLRESGKPMITGFGPSTLTADLAPLGLFLRDNLSPADIEKRFFTGRTDGYHAYEHMHFAEAVVG